MKNLIFAIFTLLCSYSALGAPLNVAIKISHLDIDNHPNGLGLGIEVDSRLNRVFQLGFQLEKWNTGRNNAGSKFSQFSAGIFTRALLRNPSSLTPYLVAGINHYNTTRHFTSSSIENSDNALYFGVGTFLHLGSGTSAGFAYKFHSPEMISGRETDYESVEISLRKRI